MCYRFLPRVTSLSDTTAQLFVPVEQRERKKEKKIKREREKEEKEHLIPSTTGISDPIFDSFRVLNAPWVRQEVWSASWWIILTKFPTFRCDDPSRLFPEAKFRGNPKSSGGACTRRFYYVRGILVKIDNGHGLTGRVSRA